MTTIGITLDSEEPGGYSPLPWYALRKEYFASVARRGATPIGLPHEPSQVSAYLDMIDGLLLTGGDVDIPPEMYGEQGSTDTLMLKDGRTQFEVALTNEALQRNMPILGVCAGEQLLNVLHGGTLIQHIPDEIDDALEHQQPTPRTEPWHKVTLNKNSKLYAITQTETYRVNSNHHQAVKDVGKGLIVNATAPDGVIEGIERPDHPFCIGVEWHPELEICPQDTALMDAFIAACHG